MIPAARSTAQPRSTEVRRGCKTCTHFRAAFDGDYHTPGHDERCSAPCPPRGGCFVTGDALADGTDRLMLRTGCPVWESRRPLTFRPKTVDSSFPRA